VILSKLKASLAVAAMTLVSYSPVWAQLCDNPDNPDCNTGGGGGGGNGTPELDGPGMLMLITIGIVAAIAIARRK
jgi:hypothetical protein